MGKQPENRNTLGYRAISSASRRGKRAATLAEGKRVSDLVTEDNFERKNWDKI